MKGLMLNKPSRVARNNGYFNMIADEFIKPSKRAEDLNESYFKDYVKKQYTNKAPAEVIAQAKKILRESTTPVYFKPDFEKTLSLDDIAERVLLAETAAMNSLDDAKKYKDQIISDLAKTRYVQFSKNKAIKEVENSISIGIPSSDLESSGNISRFNQVLSALLNYKAYWAVAAAYTAEYNKREKDSKDVTAAIEKGDVAALKTLRSKVNVEELKTSIDDAIKTIEEAKKAEEEKQKAVAEAKRKLTGATTPEEKASAQAELDALLRAGSQGAGAIATKTGLPKGAIYIGIGLVVAIGAYLMFKKKA